MDKEIHILDPSEVAVSAHNLVDIQNYLVTFNKEIEGADPSSLPVITDADGSDVSDILSSVSGAQSLHVGVDSSGSGHFSTAFYTEQSLLDSGLGEDSAHNIHSLEGVESDIATQIKQEPNGLDLDNASMATVHAQLAGLTGSISDMTPQELIMTAVNDTLDINEGKVIRIVSLSQDGSILSLGDGSHMQILGEEHSNIGSDLKDLNSSLEALGQPLIMASSSHDLLDSSPSSSMSNPAPTTTITSSTVDLLNSEAVSEGSSEQGEGLSISSQPHLVALQSGIEGLSPETLQALTLAGDDTGTGTPLVLSAGGSTLQTFALVPSEGQNGEMQYVLLVTRTSGSNIKDSLDEESGHLEDFIQEDGTVKHILKITPKKLFPASLTNSSQLTCNYCDYTSPKRYLLTRHMKTHSEDRPHKCNVCNRGFKTYASLNNHVNTHTGIRPHKCKECQAAFTTSGELVRHVRYRHTFEKPHKCPECDYASVELSKLKRHLRSHTGERPYQCGHCTYASPDTYKLKRHMRIHTGEKPYLCDICNARFTQSNSLKAHKLIHSGNKPVFQCPYCPTTCGRKTDLKIHLQKLHCSDEPIACRKCGESFPDRYNFKLHWKTREADKSYRCQICDYIACSQRHLDSHVSIHSEEKSFECDECNLTFRQKQLLKQHRIQHHAAEDQPTSDKETSQECAACNKSITEKGDAQQHTCGEDLSEDDTMSAGSADEMPSFRSLTAEHVLQGNLMQEWRDGKLGNAPQVVIVHPDGRIEEVTPKLQLPPDRTLEGVGVKSAKNSKASQSSSAGKMPMTSGARVQKNIVSHSPVEMDEDDSHREASTQVELASDTSDEENGEHEEEDDEDDDKMDSNIHFLSARPAEGSTIGSVLEAGGITLFPAASASEIENMIASLPLISAPITLAQPTPNSQDQQILTIDAPEILAHLDLTSHTIKQEKADGSEGENITLTLFPASSDSSVASIAPAKVVVAGGVQSGSQGQAIVLTSGRKGSAAAMSVTTEMVLASKAVTLVASDSDASKVGESKTRVLKRKEPDDTPLPAKRTRKTVIDQQYMYI